MKYESSVSAAHENLTWTMIQSNEPTEKKWKILATAVSVKSSDEASGWDISDYSIAPGHVENKAHLLPFLGHCLHWGSVDIHDIMRINMKLVSLIILWLSFDYPSAVLLVISFPSFSRSFNFSERRRTTRRKVCQYMQHAAFEMHHDCRLQRVCKWIKEKCTAMLHVALKIVQLCESLGLSCMDHYGPYWSNLIHLRWIAFVPCLFVLGWTVALAHSLPLRQRRIEAKRGSHHWWHPTMEEHLCKGLCHLHTQGVSSCLEGSSKSFED